jgi:hypothetical protein
MSSVKILRSCGSAAVRMSTETEKPEFKSTLDCNQLGENKNNKYQKDRAVEITRPDMSPPDHSASTRLHNQNYKYIHRINECKRL